MTNVKPEDNNAGRYAVEQPISETPYENLRPYAMSVIVSRAIPEIDGFKPAHRKLLYTMYPMNLISAPREIGRCRRTDDEMNLTEIRRFTTMVRLTRQQITITPMD